MPILFKLFCKTETEGTFPNPFYEAKITLLSKPHKGPTKKENNRPVFLMNICTKILLKNTYKPNPRTHQKDYLPWSNRLHPEPKSHDLLDVEKAFDRMQQSLMIKFLKRLGIYGA